MIAIQDWELAMSQKGLLIVYTGNGKGKTTAALGLAFRALGHGRRVAVIQFIKGKWKCGEIESAKRFGGMLEIHVMGKGFTWVSKDIGEDARAANEAWTFAKKTIQAGRHDLVVLDELTYLIKYKMVSEAEILAALSDRPGQVDVVVTGRGAGRKLIDMADLATEMRKVKHPFEHGVKARKGIEF